MCKIKKIKKNNCFGENFEFPAKPDVFRKNQGLCALMGKIPEQMPFKFFKYLFKFSRYEGTKS